MKSWMIIASVAVCAACSGMAAPLRQSEDLFPFQPKHVHGSSLVQCPNGDFLAAWFHGSGERGANDVVVNGARLKKGAKEWSPLFLMADTPGFPDCNPVLYIDKQERLWLFWVPVLANQWEDCLLKYRRADQYQKNGAPQWNWQDVIVLDPGEEFPADLKRALKESGTQTDMWAAYAPQYEKMLVEAAGDKFKRQMGWMTRIHPITLTSGRILLPLYSDGFNAGLVAISDDQGANWRASKPIAGQAPIQPALVQKKDGSVAAFMRDSGGAPNRVMTSTSMDNGETWTTAKDTEIPNPGSSLDVIALRSGAWLMVANDTENGRQQMTALLSEDEGATWKYRRKIEPNGGKGRAFAYPSVLQARDGNVHMTYSVHGDKENTIRHTVINEEWVRMKDEG